MKKMNAHRWGLVTFAACVATSLAGHFLPAPVAVMVCGILSVAFAAIGTICIMEDQNP